MMLQRAASSAYSWWWASHIRTKQSKWLEQNLHDIEEKVQYALKLLEEEGDSFAKRAEMYYKRRPELISFVEESYKAYRALAERYDHISTELQNANATIASVFPDQVPEFAMGEDDDENDVAQPRFHKNHPEISNQNIPKVPELPSKENKGVVAATAKKFLPRKSVKGSDGAAAAVNKSGLSKAEAVKEIDKLQKEILALQTEKEFVKSSYESGLGKYWDIDKAIKEKQERIYSLLDEFDECVVIEDGEAQRLMVATALKSCKEKLAELKHEHEKTVDEANIERKRIQESIEDLVSLTGKFVGNGSSQGDQSLKDELAKREKGLEIKEEEEEEETNSKAQKHKELELLREKIKEHFGANTSLTITVMAEKMDELVNKVISLEPGVTSQTVLTQRLRTEIHDLQTEIRGLQEEKLSLKDDNTDLRNKLREMEEKLKGIKDIDRMVLEHSENLETQFAEAGCKISCLSENLISLKPEGELKETSAQIQDEGSQTKTKSSEEHKGKSAAAQNDESMNSHNAKADKEPNIALAAQKEEHALKGRFKDQDVNFDTSVGSENLQGVKAEEEDVVTTKDRTEEANQAQACKIPENSIEEHASCEGVGELPKMRKEAILEKQISPSKEDNLPVTATPRLTSGADAKPFLQNLQSNGMVDREKLLLAEYTALLRNYEEVKRKLGETEVKLKYENATKDEKIRFLYRKLSLLQKGFGDGDDLHEFKATEDEHDQLITLMGREDNSHMMATGHKQTVSSIDQQFRARIDALLGKNLDFLVRFSASFGQVRQFDTGVHDLQAEILKIEEQKIQDGGSTTKYSLRSDVHPIYKHLREIHTEMTVWLEKSALLKEEIKSRSSSLCSLQDEITEALEVDSENEEMKFTSYQAAKFHGETSNMTKENNRIADELQAGIDQVTTLQLEAEKTMEKLNEEFLLSGSMNKSSVQQQHSHSKTRIPLRSFLFDTKPKKQRLSIFSCMHPLLIKKIRHGS